MGGCLVEQFIQILLNSLQGIAIYSLSTMGIVLVFKTSGTTNFSQGVVGVFGAYMSTQLARLNGVPLFFSILIGVAVAFLIGMGIDVGIIRRGKNLNSSQKQIVTMGLLLIITNLIPVIFGLLNTLTQQTPNYATGITQFSLFGMNLAITNQALMLILVSGTLLLALFIGLKYTKWGLGVRATASNETVAQMMGINTRLITALSWAIASGLATVSATMLASTLNPAMMGKSQVYGFLASVLGGLSSFFAPLVGAVLLPIFANISATFSSIWADGIVFVLVLIIILIFPNGIFGKKYVKKV